jgi:chitin synthase
MSGAGDLIDLLRYFIISSMALYILPIALYGIFFLRLKYLWEIITGTLSFLFYSPSYLNLLNVYALCRIDDISWGTKGLDASVGGKNAKLK